MGDWAGLYFDISALKNVISNMYRKHHQVDFILEK